ncbi:type II toxin-antitoxin system VapC family toxin [Leptolyngbya ectocarpi]|uniref:type II toxin-antitoxin system VapC family toxin n=1 Tax=Leptolyngbya ectocarpi TaxID=1202 RepID=UPI001D13F5C6
MRILLDTHIFLWFISGDTRLSNDIRDAIRNPANEVYLSAVSIWEAIVKYQLGKLPLPEHPGIYLPKQRTLHQISSLALDENSVVQLSIYHRYTVIRLIGCLSAKHYRRVYCLRQQTKQFVHTQSMSFSKISQYY